jgi:hypothetical protein
MLYTGCHRVKIITEATPWKTNLNIKYEVQYYWPIINREALCREKLVWQEYFLEFKVVIRSRGEGYYGGRETGYCNNCKIIIESGLAIFCHPPWRFFAFLFYLQPSLPHIVVWPFTNGLPSSHSSSVSISLIEHVNKKCISYLNVKIVKLSCHIHLLCN